ncbi:MAG TPA: LysR family transcriptional regulator [Chthonomonadales bacterium]|nr:LysR family transcriptional regulator [Chthonomonadales bacterium]
MMDDFNLYPLHVFRVVARLGSVTRAAEELCISQPAVSFHLKSVQARYGETLLERTPRGMITTCAGALVASNADRLFALLEDTRAAVASSRHEVKGAVIVASSSTPGAYLAPRLLRQFQDRHPGVTTELMVGDSVEAISWLQNYRAGLGVVGDTRLPESMERKPIAQDELRLVAAACDPLCRRDVISRSDLAGRTLFLRETGSSTRAGAERLLCEWLDAFERVESLRSSEAIKQAAIARLGVAVLSSWATELEERAGLLAPVSDMRFRHARSFYAVRRSDRPFVGAAAALWELLVTGSYT